MNLNLSAVRRLFAGIRQTESGCWQWTKCLDNQGYGRILIDHKNQKAYRAMWQFMRGTIPRGLYVDHICRNRGCVNPEHLRLVTPKQNAVENSLGVSAKNASKEHCPAGHPYSGSNLRIASNRRGRKMRLCRECDNRRHREKYARNRESL